MHKMYTELSRAMEGAQIVRENERICETRTQVYRACTVNIPTLLPGAYIKMPLSSTVEIRSHRKYLMKDPEQ